MSLVDEAVEKMAFFADRLQRLTCILLPIKNYMKAFKFNFFASTELFSIFVCRLKNKL